MSEWISVKDRMPDEPGTYLVNIHGEDENDVCDFVTEAWYTPLPALLFNEEVGRTMLNEFYEFASRLREQITHWMPLPELPAEEE